MKTQHEDDWEAQREELIRDDTGIGKEFLKFFEAWVDLAEDIMVTHPDKTAIEAIRLAFPLVEGKLGDVTTGLMAQMLVLLIAFWKFGPEVSAGLSPLEMKMVLEAIAIKHATLQDSAILEAEIVSADD